MTSTQNYVENFKKSIVASKSDKSASIKVFKSLRAWINARVSIINYERDSPIGILKNAFDMSNDIDDVDDDEMEYIMETLNDYFDVVSIDELDGKEYDIQTNMSDNLLKIMNKNSSNKSNGSSDWKPPSIHGLRNSSPIIKKSQFNQIAPSKQNTVTFEFKSSKNAEQTYNSYIGNTIANKISNKNAANNFPSEPKVSITLPVNNKKLNVDLNPIDEDDSDDSDIDDDDNDDYRYSDDNDEDNVFANLNMSANLMEALGLSTSNVNKATDWKPPAAPGLSNSNPLIISGSNSKRQTRNSSPIDSTYVNQHNNNSSSKKSLRIFSPINSAYQSQVISNNDYLNEKIGDDDDYDEDNDGDDDNDYNDYNETDDVDYVPSGAMSASLMEALGLSTSHIDKSTDWKPPTKTGLAYSAPIVAGLSLNSYSRK